MDNSLSWTRQCMQTGQKAACPATINTLQSDGNQQTKKGFHMITRAFVSNYFGETNCRGASKHSLLMFIVYVVVSWRVQIMLWIKQCHLTKTKHFSETFYSTLGPGPVIISAGKQKIQRFEFHSNGHGVKCKRNVPPTHQYVLVQWCEINFVMNGQSQQIWVWCCLAETLAIWLTRGHSQLCTVVAIQALVAFRWIFIPVATDQWCFALYRSDLHHAVHASNAVAIWVQLFISIIWHVSEHGWCTWIWFSGILMTYSNNMRPTSGNMNRGPPQAFQSVPASKCPQNFTADGLDLWRCRLSNLDSHCNCCVFRKCANSDYHSIKWNL